MQQRVNYDGLLQFSVSRDCLAGRRESADEVSEKKLAILNENEEVSHAIQMQRVILCVEIR